ncbi:MAG: type IV pilin protein [Gammaproteobacteria bacterium]|jgi:type IV pilus assembly protein PilE
MAVKGSKQRGFTLIELMVTVAILGIVAGIAVPQYHQYVQRTNRADAQRSLIILQQRLENCWTQTHDYMDEACPQIGEDGISSNDEVYTITANLGTTTYTLEATPKADGPQAGDDRCYNFIVNHLGNKTSENKNGDLNEANTCW